ncbi:right-handed parallel beta-helix repeat-containing protein [Egbenema bharatensis]|uniref:right-handed parallel beta-helix repeat-containing protein n=1 Tax=Egbenema bharatensis TaxID=3463334 RepID=UPI003A83B648
MHPWATVSHATQVLKAGDTLYIREGTYPLSEPVQAKYSGTARAWITYRAFPGERVILDAEAVPVAPPSGQPPYAHDQGAFQLENVGYIRVQNLEIINSHNSGITVRNSHHIALYNNTIKNTFSPGIGLWNSQHQKVIGNTVINANDPEMAGFSNNFPEPPHEAISLGSVENFEVAFNLLQDGKKEGIDIKEESKFGTVHHNHIHHMLRQGLYVDSWYGQLKDVELYNNVVHDCQSAGFALSVEGGAIAKQIRFHHNLLYDNWGTGIFFSRWGNDGLRQNIEIENNTVYHNGYGEPSSGKDFYWLTGGLYLFSDHLQNVQIKHNIFSENTGFQIGYSDRYLDHNSTIEESLAQKNIAIETNLIFGANSSTQPIYAGWTDNYAHIYGTNGDFPLLKQPEFVDPEMGNFYLQPAFLRALDSASPESPPVTIGAFPASEPPDLWWQDNFPPQFLDEPAARTFRQRLPHFAQPA